MRKSTDEFAFLSVHSQVWCSQSAWDKSGLQTEAERGAGGNGAPAALPPKVDGIVVPQIDTDVLMCSQVPLPPHPLCLTYAPYAASRWGHSV